MKERLDQYLNGVFAPYEGVKSVAELRADLLSDLQERFRELKAEGKDDETAYEMTIDSIGDIEQTVLEVANLSRSLERQALTNFSGSNLPKGDLKEARCAVPTLRAQTWPAAHLRAAMCVRPTLRAQT
jgi:hypothetical protein